MENGLALGGDLCFIKYSAVFRPKSIIPTILTPHVLSEWMVEVCGP